MMPEDFVKYYDVEYGSKLAGRAPTFRAVLREAVSHGVKSIVETGCTRKEGNWAGDGQSTIIWDKYAAWYVASLHVVDIDQDAVELARKLAPSRAIVTCEDSVGFLSKHKFQIDLLYLDSFDVDMANPHAAALHCLFEFCAARPLLHTNSIVFIDDSPMDKDWVVGGKGMYVDQYFKQLGILPFTFGYQTAWLMP